MSTDELTSKELRLLIRLCESNPEKRLADLGFSTELGFTISVKLKYMLGLRQAALQRTAD